MASGDAEMELEPESPVSKVREYNFKTANKFPKEQIRTLNIVSESFARLLSTSLSGTLRAVCDVEIVSVEEQTFMEYNNSLPSMVLLAILELHPMAGNVLLEISPTIAYAMINRLFGGSDEFSDTGKAFTEIESSIMERIIRRFMGLLEESWEKVAKINAVLDRIETSAQFAQIVPLNEPIAIITFNVSIGKISGLMNLVMPHMAIQPISKQLNTRLWYSGLSSSVERHTDEINARLSTTNVALRAIFNETIATVNDVLCLQVGDVIRLSHDIDVPITINVEHLPKFKGVIGSKGAHYAIKIVDVIKEEADYE
jgi:flagellar motor switch protein FliM